MKYSQAEARAADGAMHRNGLVSGLAPAQHAGAREIAARITGERRWQTMADTAKGSRRCLRTLVAAHEW